MVSTTCMGTKAVEEAGCLQAGPQKGEQHGVVVGDLGGSRVASEQT